MKLPVVLQRLSAIADQERYKLTSNPIALVAIAFAKPPLLG
ncbi:hypothetical protein [Nostoc sp.]